MFYTPCSSIAALFIILSTLFPSFAQSPKPATPVFRDVSARSGIDQVVGFKYGGPIVADLNRDGWDDLILNEHELTPLRLYTRATRASFAPAYRHFQNIDLHGITTHDFNGDGRQDLLLAGGGAFGTMPSSPFVFQLGGGAAAAGRGDMTVEVLPTPAYGLNQYNGRLRAVRMVDLDLDGDQDLVVTARTNTLPTASVLGEMVFYENNGRDTWKAYTTGTPLFNAQCSTAVLTTDVDNDQIMDLVCTERSDITIYKGTGSFPTPFVDVSRTWLAGITRKFSAFYDYMTELDYDNDGLMDVYVSCGLNYTLLACDDILLRNTGTHFVDVSREARLPLGGIHQEPAVGDFNMDGFVDMLIPTYQTAPGSGDASPNLLLINRGDGTFNTVARHNANVLPSQGLRGAGAAAILMNTGGRLDIVVGYEGPGSGGPWKLYKNRTRKNGSNFLALKVRDIPGHSARGARVVIQVGDRTMTRRVGNDGGEAQSLPTRVHFGLGTATMVVSVKVYYVGGGFRSKQFMKPGFRTIG